MAYAADGGLGALGFARVYVDVFRRVVAWVITVGHLEGYLFSYFELLVGFFRRMIFVFAF